MLQFQSKYYELEGTMDNFFFWSNIKLKKNGLKYCHASFGYDSCILQMPAERFQLPAATKGIMIYS